MNHSPAPWKTDRDMGNEIVVAPNGDLVADCAIFMKGRTAEENRANARLCSAAPDLYEALKAFEEHFGPLEGNVTFNDDVNRCYRLARKALAKADGVKTKAR